MLDQAFESLKTLDWGSDPKALAPIDQAVVDTQGNAAGRAALESRLAALLSEGISRDAKDYVCRKLMLIGTTASVPALAKLLRAAETSHMARYALDRNPAPEATAALRDALPKLSGAQKIGVIGSLGVRRDAESVKPLAALLADSDAAVCVAAAKALGAIRTKAAATALLDGKPSPAATDALLACAEGLLSDGNRDAALAIYVTLNRTKQPEHIRLAATRGKLMCAGVAS